MQENEVIGGKIHPLSVTTVFIEMLFNETLLASGTAFFVSSSKGPVLMTNWHNLTGRNPETNECLSKHCAVPNLARVKLLGPHQPLWFKFDLERDGRPVWVEHSIYGAKVDVVGVLLSELKDYVMHYVGIDEGWCKLDVADRIHIVGYPFGMHDNFAIWATGFVASEPETNYRNLPAFLVDCRARKGQSGSLVLSLIKPGDAKLHNGKLWAAQKEMVHYLGIYSGRINNDSDLGIVWKKGCIEGYC
ncbi:hypothetical protein [Gilvimarinus algae]|uniref:Serine protease n=1 Tax=Gilvimarinus algae TaxID=3058037 RepID=A0ABT8TAU7_9GAMM|nr:hypothetical protein [Gilvimarinus sp. SDUM040014]MDO3380755.1 hypothetical protein [Gilvimarinus sp. SDUM040014]